MRRTLTLFLFAVQICAMSAPMSGSLQGDDLSAKLNRKVSDYNIGLLNFPGALLRISTDFRIPMGIVWTNSPATHAEMPLAWKHATVQEIIQSIAETQPDYRVQVRNGVVHVFPSIPDNQNFLKVRIDAFQTQNSVVELASLKLHMLVTPIKGSHQISVAGPGDSTVTVNLKNCTVEDALDAIAVNSTRKVWIVTFQDDTSVTMGGLRRTRSLYTEARVPDEEQPVWYLNRWGDPTPPLISGGLSNPRHAAN